MSVGPLVGKVEGFHGDMMKIVCPNAPPSHQVHYLTAAQARSAKMGDRVKLEYRSTATYGQWVVTEVLS